jgi:hypothetical protein
MLSLRIIMLLIIVPVYSMMFVISLGINCDAWQEILPSVRWFYLRVLWIRRYKHSFLKFLHMANPWSLCIRDKGSVLNPTVYLNNEHLSWTSGLKYQSPPTIFCAKGHNCQLNCSFRCTNVYFWTVVYLIVLFVVKMYISGVLYCHMDFLSLLQRLSSPPKKLAEFFFWQNLS